jgi:magnesium-transporting ATPase (P-type)
MKLKKIAVDSTHIMDVDPEDLFKSARAPSEVKDLTPYGLLIEAMSVCHTVKPIKQKGMMNESLKYYSSSPDEVALIESLDNDFDLQLIDNKNNLISLKSSYAIGLHK